MKRKAEVSQAVRGSGRYSKVIPEESTETDQGDTTGGQLTLLSRKAYLLFACAVVGGVSLNGYHTYREEGRLDTSWLVSGAISVVLAAAIMFFVARHANKPESED